MRERERERVCVRMRKGESVCEKERGSENERELGSQIQMRERSQVTN